MKKTVVTILVLILLVNYVNAQISLRERTTQPPKERFADKLFFGGAFGLQFGSQTYIELAPIIGYKVTDRLSAGLGLKYIYYKFNDAYTNYSYSSNMYGGGPFLNFSVFEGFFLHAEYEVLNMDIPDYSYSYYTRQNVTSVFLGGGYRQMIGDRSSLDFLLLYNINDSSYSPYDNPVIRIGFGFGI